MKAKKLKSKRKFYSQLRNHLKSPGAKKVLKNRHKQQAPKQIPHIAKVCPFKANHHKTLRKAGEKSENPDELFFQPAISNTQLVKEKVNLSKMITASLVASVKKSPQSEFQKSSQHSDNPTSCQSNQTQNNQTLPVPDLASQPKQASIKNDDASCESYLPPSSDSDSAKMKQLQAWLNSCDKPLSSDACENSEHSSFYLDHSSDSDSSLLDCADVKHSPSGSASRKDQVQHDSKYQRSACSGSGESSKPLNCSSNVDCHSNKSMNCRNELSSNYHKDFVSSNCKEPYSSLASNDAEQNTCFKINSDISFLSHREGSSKPENQVNSSPKAFETYEERWSAVMARICQDSSPEAVNFGPDLSLSEDFHLQPYTPENPMSFQSKQKLPKNVNWSDSSDSDFGNQTEFLPLHEAGLQRVRSVSPSRNYEIFPLTPLQVTKSSPQRHCPVDVTMTSDSEADDVFDHMTSYLPSSESPDLSSLKQFCVTADDQFRLMTSQSSENSSPLVAKAFSM